MCRSAKSPAAWKTAPAYRPKPRNVTVWPDSLAGPAEMPVAQVATDRGTAVFQHGLIGPFGERWSHVRRGVPIEIVNVCGAEVSMPPSFVPPVSFNRTVTTAVPMAFLAGM